MNENRIGLFIAELRKEKNMTSSMKSIASFRHILTISFSALLLLGILVCVICDLAISGSLTWSWYPVSSILFAWFVCVPIIKFGKNGIIGSLAAVSVFILPFLAVLSRLVGGNNLIMPIGTRTALPSVIYLWCVYLIFHQLSLQKILAAAYSLLLAIPLYLIIHLILADMLAIPFLDLWGLLSLSEILLCAMILYLIDHIRKIKKRKA